MSKILTRIICLVLAGLMVMGIAYYIIACLRFDVHAEDRPTNPVLSVGIVYEED